MKWDKEFAKTKKRRISEKTLFTFALFMGAAGIWAGMYKFRHKTKHMSFVILVPVCLILNIIAFYKIVSFLLTIKI